MQNKCAVQNCLGGKLASQPIFRFPHDPQRCKKWVENCQRKDLLEKPAEHLYRYYRLCGKHFDTSAFDGDVPGTVLKVDAVPTMFDFPPQLQTEQVKHGKETAKDDETVGGRGRKRIKKSPPEAPQEDTQAAPEGEQKKYLKSLFEALLLLGKQGIPPSVSADDNEGLKLSFFQALLDYGINCGDELLKKKYDASKQFCFLEELDQLTEVCEKYVCSKLIEEVNLNGHFSLLTDEPVKISNNWCLPVFIRFLDQSKCLQERFAGFLSVEGDDVAEKMLTELVDKWGLDMDHCRSQAHSSSGTHFKKVKAFAAKVTEKYPKALLTFRSTHALNVSLANSISLSGVQLVMSTFKKIDSFFRESPLLQLEFEHAISIFYPDKEDKANELKEICRTSWTRGPDAFEVALEVLEALLLCVDSLHDNEDMRWSDQVAHNALEISKALTDFEFIMALLVLKNVTVLTQAFGKNLQGEAAEAHLAAVSFKAVTLALKEVSDNIDVYHEFWFDEAVNLATAMEIPVSVPRLFFWKHQEEPGTIQPDTYYKENLSVPVVNHIMREVDELFSDTHLETLRCLSLVPAVIEQNKTTQPEELNLQMFNDDIPNAASLSAELHCWLVKWSKKGKGETFPSSLHETLQLADVKFFPNVLVVLRLLRILPTLPVEDSCDVAYKRFRMYLENIPDKFKSRSLALLNINEDVELDLDSMVEMYMKMFPERQDES
ncbi:THAP domain containing 12a [Austrofundulus limnaeus]|uniref:THAP domain containing 12a n=1 Tax=Austrofundulus limnaeus TaxID=52670 RepID=A0A2I4B6L2_AUSLI|nr:PREDICTED: 52 kDa repressor of the inhibitor of the protein kinase-like [Austrofundulus limnaeus]